MFSIRGLTTTFADFLCLCYILVLKMIESSLLDMTTHSFHFHYCTWSSLSYESNEIADSSRTAQLVITNVVMERTSAFRTFIEYSVASVDFRVVTLQFSAPSYCFLLSDDYLADYLFYSPVPRRGPSKVNMASLEVVVDPSFE